MPHVAVVIPAFNEEACIGDVLARIPPTACGLSVETIVVDDGSTDRTAEIARQGGAHVAGLERNSGQGAALRIGYGLARERGAGFIVTLDADGQWDPADLPGVLQPVVDGDADLVLGSRALGSNQSRDVIRRAGVRTFAALVRVLTGVPVTDTSSGLRAMTAEVAANVRLQQPQYQAAELLLGAIYRGYRIAERPVAMHPRAAGESKKGHNVLYGFRYARVIVRTWWRERRSAARPPPSARARVAPLMPALRVLGYVAAVAILAYMTLRAADDVRPRDLVRWPLPFAAACTAIWWLLLARGWALLVAGRLTRADVSVWCRTQALRFLPGGFWAPTSRATVVQGSVLDRVLTVAGENLLSLAAAVAVGGAALAAAENAAWLGLTAALAVPLAASRLAAGRTRVTPARSLRATGNYLVAFVAYALAAALVQVAVSSDADPLAAAGSASLAWAAGLVVVIAPSGVGVRELVYARLLSDSVPFAEAAAAAVTLRLVTIVVEIAVLVLAGRPVSTPSGSAEALD
jgi:Glycosyl transferase family 2